MALVLDDPAGRHSDNIFALGDFLKGTGIPFKTAAREIPLKVLAMDNGSAMATGGQPIPAGLYAQVLAGWASYVSRIDDPRDKAAVRGVLEKALRSDRLEIVSARFRA